MYSFYGGRPGNSFTIVASFPNVQTMVEQFKQGPAYTEVHYDEHVIINTEDKNNPTNGQIYRRGYDYNNDMGGAELIGTIVGPAGKAPMLIMDKYQSIQTAVDNADNGISGNAQGYESMSSSGQLKTVDADLIPGKYIQNNTENFNDTIQWISYSLRDGQGKDTTAHIGFKIPYPVIDFETENTDFWASSTATRIDNTEHPFYEKWKITIPKGQKGDSIQNFRVITPNINNVSNYDNKYNDIPGNENGQRQEGRQILVYDYYVYQENESPTNNPVKETLYIGDYNVIENINLSQTGILTVNYTHDDANEINSENPLIWIKNLTLNTDGSLQATYNTNPEQPVIINNNNKIKWIEDIKLDSNGALSVLYNGENNGIDDNSRYVPINDQYNRIKWIEGIRLDADGTFSVKYNNEMNNISLGTIQFINSIALTNEGLLQVTYNTDPEPVTINSDKIKWIEGINYDNTDGKLTFTYNVLEEGSNKKASEVFSLNVPTEIKVQHIPDPAETNTVFKDMVTVKYTGQQGETPISVLNSVKKLKLSDDGHLLVQYTDESMNTDATTETTTISTTDSGTTSETIQEHWRDLGLISPEVFGFKEDTSTITNKYTTGILVPSAIDSGFEDLVLDLNTNQFLSNNVQSISITGGSLIVNPSQSVENQITIDFSQASYSHQIESNLFGLKIIIKDVSNKGLTQSSSVNVLINSLIFGFTFKQITSETTVIDSDNLQSIKNQINENSSAISAIGNVISMTEAADTQYLEAGKTILETINELKEDFNQKLTAAKSELQNNINDAANAQGLSNLNTYSIRISSSDLSQITLTDTYIGIWKRTNAQTRPNGNRLGTGTDVVYGVAVENTLDSQKNGYVLHFCHCSTSGDVDVNPYNNCYFFLPKSHIEQISGQGIQIPLSWGGSIAGKYVYVYNKSLTKNGVTKTYTIIRGHVNNAKSQTINGITYHNDEYALIAVYGV